MKILHFSDTHLGFNDLEKVNALGVNQREADFYDAFSQVIEACKTLKPDYIIHTGDLFHRPSPSNRAITFCIEQFKLIEQLNIPFIIIAGNHSTPRTTQSSPILKMLESFEGVYAVYNQAYETIEFDDIIFYAIPHINDDKVMLEELEKVEDCIKKSKKNIMMLHASVGAHYLMQEFGEFVYPKNKEYLFEKLDYVALGHWHGFNGVNKHSNVFYSGSLERTSINDKRNDKGFVLVSLEESLNVEFHPIQIRPSYLLKIDCQNFDTSLQKALEEAKNINIEGAILEVKLFALTPTKSIDISNKMIEELFAQALVVLVKREFIQVHNEVFDEQIESVSLQALFLEQLKENIHDEKEYERISYKLNDLFDEYEKGLNDSM